MQSAWNEIQTFFRIAEQGGAYASLGLLAVLFCLIKGTKQNRERRVAAGFCVIAFLMCNPITVYAYAKLTGQTYPLWKVTLAIPLLPLIAYCGTELTALLCENKKTWYRIAVTAALAVVILTAGTIVPFSAREDLKPVKEVVYGREDEMIEQIREAAGQLRTEGAEPLLVAPKGIMNSIRRYDGQIRLVYGRNLWQTGALDYLHETYSGEAVLLCQKMESAEVNSAETAELALALGCNLIVCREELTDTFLTHHGLELFASEHSLYLYIRR